MTTKERLHRLVETIPTDDLSKAEAALEKFSDPVLRAFIEAPEDDEPLTSEEIAAVEEAKAEIAQGSLVPWAAVKARLFRES